MKKKEQFRTSLIVKNNSYVAEPLSVQLKRALESKDPIKADAAVVYGDEYNEAFDIRTDRWELALDTIDRVEKAQIAKNKATLESNKEVKTEE